MLLTQITREKCVKLFQWATGELTKSEQWNEKAVKILARIYKTTSLHSNKPTSTHPIKLPLFSDEIGILLNNYDDIFVNNNIIPTVKLGNNIGFSFMISDLRKSLYPVGTIQSNHDISYQSGTGRDNKGRRLIKSGIFNCNTSMSFEGGMVINFIIENANVLGTTITISAYSQSESRIILPLGSAEILFTRFGSEPQHWMFDISTNSDAFICTYKVYSTWVPGDRPNR
jgi:hypothetical protein